MSRMTLKRLPAEVAEAENLPAAPSVAIQLMRAADDPNSRVEHLGSVVRQDPALAAHLLKMVNSAAHGMPRTIDSVERACALLGFRKTRTLALGLSVADAMPVIGPETGFDLTEYWLRSGLTAAASELFAEQVLPRDSDVAYVNGLLSNMGRLILAHCMTSVYGSLLRQVPWPTQAQETEYLGFSNTDITVAMFQDWNLPDEIVQPIAFRSAPDELDPGTSSEIIRLTRVLAAADYLADAWASAGESSDLTRASEAAAYFLKMEPDAFVQVVNGLRDRVISRETFKTIAPPPEVDVRSIEQEACERLKQAVASTNTTSRLADLLRASEN